MRSHVAWLAVVVLGCGAASETEEGSAAVAASEAASAAAPAGAAAHEAAAGSGSVGASASGSAAASGRDVPELPDERAVPFRWFEAVGPDGVASSGNGIGTAPRLHLAIVGDERAFEARRDGDAIVLARTGEHGWSVRVEGPITSEPVLADLSRSDDAMIVAARTPRGWISEARGERDGALRWRAEAEDATHGNGAVQLGVTSDAIAVYVRGASEDHVDLVDPADGRVLGRRRFEPSITRVSVDRPARAIASASVERGRPVTIGGARWSAHCSTSGGGSSALVAQPVCALHRSGGDDPDERGELAATFASYAPPGCRSLAIAEAPDLIVIAEHCFDATGVTVHAIEREGMIERWTVRPFGIGPIAHSRWSNDVAIAIDGARVHVWGTESGSRYVSTIDLASGNELATIIRRSR